MKRVTATDARRNWFRLLDEIASGQEVVVERAGHSIVLRVEEASAGRSSGGHPDYRALLDVRELDDADLWSWEWISPSEKLRPIRRRRMK